MFRSDSEDDLEDISTADSPVTNNSQTSTPPHQHLLIQQQLHHQQEDSHIGIFLYSYLNIYADNIILKIPIFV